jgi:ribonucleotide monophosphatase NagD (HAD superfamily)
VTLERKPKGFMFDLDGTLILSDRKLGGYTAIPGAAEALAELDERGIPWIAMTNGRLRSKRAGPAFARSWAAGSGRPAVHAELGGRPGDGRARL